jgi:DNA-binding response OmpR family regulator
LLIVEQAEIGNDLADTLEILGYTVTDILTSAKPPLESAYDLEADVVVLDLQVKDTADPVGAGRLISRRWERPVIYLVDDTQQADRVSRDGCGALFVMWPFSPDVLDTAIQEGLASKARAITLERHPPLDGGWAETSRMKTAASSLTA